MVFISYVSIGKWKFFYSGLPCACLRLPMNFGAEWVSNRYSRQCRLTCQLCVLSSYPSLSCWCQAGVMIVVWQTPGNTGTRGHLVIVGTLPDCLETYRQYKHIWNKQLASPPQLGTLPPQSEGGQLTSSGNEVFVVFSLTRIWSTGRPSGTPCTTSRPVGRDTGSEHHQVTTDSFTRYLKYD